MFHLPPHQIGMTTYKQVATEARKKILGLIHTAQTSHIGSNFSCVDLMTVLFDRIDFEKDVFVLSAGWKAATLYYFLWKRGRISKEQLDSYCMEGSDFIGLAEPIIPEIIIAGGSMGLGLPGAVGIAMAKKLKKEDGTVYVLMSDGELNIGTTWESSLIAAHHKLDNLVVVVDQNGYQAMGKTDDVLKSYFPYQEWNSLRVDGHDYGLIETALNDSQFSIEPTVILAETVKGKGVSFMENDNLWHYWHIDDEHYKSALKELNG